MTNTILCECGHKLETSSSSNEEWMCPACGRRLRSPDQQLLEVVGHAVSPFKPRKSRWRWFVSGCLGGGLLGIALCAGIPTVIFWRWYSEGERLLADEITQLRKTGEPFTPDELEDYYALPPGVSDVTRIWSDASSSFNTENFKKEVADIPIIGTDESPIPRPGQPWPKFDAVRGVLAGHATSMAQLHEAAEAGGAARYKTSFQDGFAMTMDDINHLRAAARMLKLEAHVKLHEGDPAGALRSFQTMLRLGRSLESYPQLIPHLVRIAIAGIAYDLLSDILPYLELNNEECTALTRELARDDYDDGLYRALLGERVMGLHAFDHPEVATDVDVDGQNGPRWPTKWMSRDRAYYLRQIRRLIAASQDAWPAKWKTANQLDTELDQFIHGSNKLTKIQHMFSLLLLPAQRAVFVATGRIRTLRDAAIVAVVIEQFRKQTGELPESLNLLTPAQLGSVPADPFDGQPLRYRIEPDQYLVYGIGDNGQDDGGNEVSAIDHVVSVSRVARPAKR